MPDPTMDNRTREHSGEHAIESGALAEAIGRGDRDAEQLFAQHYMPRIRAMLMVRTRSRELAADLAQEALMDSLCVLRKGQLRDTARLSSFVLGVARNVLLEHIRGCARERNKTELPPDLPAAMTLDPLVEAEREAIAAQALASLDQTDRRILEMTLVEGMKPGLIASQLGMSPDVVRQRKTRATRRIMETVRSMSQKPGTGHKPSGKN